MLNQIFQTIISRSFCCLRHLPENLFTQDDVTEHVLELHVEIFSTGVPIDLFPKGHRLVHNGGFPQFEALYCGLNMVSLTEIS